MLERTEKVIIIIIIRKCKQFSLHTRELQVIKHELSMGGTLDFNFQQGVMGTVQVSDANAVVGQNGVVAQNTSMVGNAPAGVYVSTNAATPAAAPSWVH